MCDTAGKIVSDKLAIFAKNSDRSPNEPQVIEFIEHMIHTEPSVKCTYISIDQVKETNAMILSRPTWLWGGEMGVNEYGVCIGNEAVFTKGKYGEDSLIGMDYLRLALERAKSAQEAVEVITTLLEKYDQGGNCGFDKDFHYDNSFLIMDRKEIHVLETCGKKWACRKYQHASISNRLQLTEGCDAYSGEAENFKKANSDFLFSTFSFAKQRQNATCTHALDCVEDAFALLRQHSVKDPMCRGSVSSVCMHAGDLFADQTTSSMVVELRENDMKIYITGSSRPCLSLFKAYSFEKGGIIYEEKKEGESDYWFRMEHFQRGMLGKEIPEAYYQQRDELQKKILSLGREEALLAEAEFVAKWKAVSFADAKCALGFQNYWKKKNAELGKPRKEIL